MSVVWLQVNNFGPDSEKLLTYSREAQSAQKMKLIDSCWYFMKCLNNYWVDNLELCCTNLCTVQMYFS